MSTQREDITNQENGEISYEKSQYSHFMNRVICYPKKVGHFESTPHFSPLSRNNPILFKVGTLSYLTNQQNFSFSKTLPADRILCSILLYFFFFFQFQNDGLGLNIAGGNDWTNIIIPGDANSSEFHHEKNFLLADLVKMKRN